jgi:hypothetical protein
LLQIHIVHIKNDFMRKKTEYGLGRGRDQGRNAVANTPAAVMKREPLVLEPTGGLESEPPRCFFSLCRTAWR